MAYDRQSDISNELDFEGFTEQLKQNQYKSYRKTLRSIHTPFQLPGPDNIRMLNKVKIPRQRNSYLREAFFKCYFEGNYHKEEPKKALLLLAKLFFYHEELRAEFRSKYDKFSDDFLVDNYPVLKEHLNTIVNFGSKLLKEMPEPSYDIPSNDIRQNPEKLKNYFDSGQHLENIKITFKPKKSDYPEPNDLFLELAGGDKDDIIYKGDDTYIQIPRKKDSTDKFIKIYRETTNYLWTPAIACLLENCLEEIKQEIENDGQLYAKIPALGIQEAVLHFKDKNKQLVKRMTNPQIAYIISFRYQQIVESRVGSGTKFSRASILRHLNRNSP